jgi:MSHA biogenesis protein MshG
MMRALELANSSVDNSYLSASIKEIAQEVAGGENLSSAMENTMLFPPLVVQMVSSGEESGKLDDLLTFVSNYYDRKVKYSLKNLITYIEPILIFILGLVVLFIALGVFLPMWNLIKLFRG